MTDNDKDTAQRETGSTRILETNIGSFSPSAIPYLNLHLIDLLRPFFVRFVVSMTSFE